MKILLYDSSNGQLDRKKLKNRARKRQSMNNDSIHQITVVGSIHKTSTSLSPLTIFSSQNGVTLLARVPQNMKSLYIFE